MASEGVNMGSARVLRETEFAILVATEEHGEVWIPKSQVHDDSSVYASGTDGDLIVRTWFAEDKGWVLWRVLMRSS